jgi:short-subunit dehydrogenase
MEQHRVADPRSMLLQSFADGAAVVTGAASGIGLGIARSLAKHGVPVLLADVEVDAAQTQAAALRREGHEAMAVRCDVASKESVAALRSVAADWQPRVSILCNNAGVSVFRRGTFATLDDWTWMIGVNLWGVVHGIDAFLADMMSSGKACHIVNTSSMNGFVPSTQSAMYSATKYAVVGLTESLRQELAETRVGATLLAPGAVATRIFESERNRPPELAATGSFPEHVPSASYAYSNLLQPDEVGGLVVDAIARNLAYVFTDPATEGFMTERHALRIAAFRSDE